jgi:hypothetical protein
MRVKFNTEADSDNTEEENDALHEDCIRLGTEKDINFSSYSSIYTALVRCGVYSIEEL